MIQNYKDFIADLLHKGFSMAGGNSEGIYAVIPWGWNEAPPYETKVRWHVEDPEIDPWEWRIRVLAERKDIAYGKVFFKKGGYITKEWYPYFLAARRQGKDFYEEYDNGNISQYAERIYEVIEENGSLPVHTIKRLGKFTKEEGSKFDRGLTELQMKMYITMSGRERKVSEKGEEYGWSATVLCRTEDFFGKEVFEKAENIKMEEAVEKIKAQVLFINPSAEPKKIIKFIKG